MRFLLQDTASTGHELENEEIAYWLTAAGSPTAAALVIARAMFSRYAKRVDRQVGDLRVASGQRARLWQDVLAQIMTAAGALNPLEIYVGGLSRAELEADRADGDLVQPRFSVDMHRLTGDTTNELTEGV